MVVVHPESELARIRIYADGHRIVAQVRLRRSRQTCRTEIGRIAIQCELVVVPVPLRVERSEEEQMVLEAGNVAAQLGVRVVVALVQDFALQVEVRLTRTQSKIIHLQALCFELLRSEVAAHRAMERVRTRLGDDLHDTAGGLAVLRFETAGLHLDFLHERQVDAAGERTVDARVHADAAEGAVGDAHAVSNVIVFQTGRARDGRVGRSGAAAASHTRRSIEQAGDAAAHRNGLVEGVGEIGRLGGRLGIYCDRASGYLHRRRACPDFHFHADARGPPRNNLNSLNIRGLKTLLFHFDGVEAGD